MSERVKLFIAQPIINENGTMTLSLQEWQRLVTKQLPYNGNGTPETFIEAEQYSHYYDDTGGVGTIHYIKMLDNIGGDKSKGWVLA